MGVYLVVIAFFLCPGEFDCRPFVCSYRSPLAGEGYGMNAFIKRYEGLWLFTRSPAAIIAAVVALIINYRCCFCAVHSAGKPL